MSVDIRVGDCREVMSVLADASIDAVITDPPYGLGFMGKAWDKGVPGVEFWQEMLRVAKPGAYLLAFGGSRTFHRMACAIEDAGWEIRDTIMWLYGSGFPKSLDVSKAIDKMGGVDSAAFKSELAEAVRRSRMGRSEINTACGFTMRFDTPYEKDPGNWGSSLPSPEKWEVIARVLGLDAGKWSALVDRVWRGRAGAALDGERRAFGQHYERTEKGDAVLDAARQWDGWGTALKPAHEPIIMARKSLVGTVAANVLAYGTGALNIDFCRVPSGSVGRWPANVIHDGSDEVLAAFPDAPGQQGDLRETGRPRPSSGRFGDMAPPHAHAARIEADKSAARFFYCAKASRKDRDEGCEGLPLRDGGMVSNTSGQHITRRDGGAPGPVKNHHPTVKPTELMRYLCRLVTPPGGTILDPFCGSGSTGKAAVLEWCNFIGIDTEAEYAEIARARIEAARSGLPPGGAAA